jgi:hypothetical protein
MTNKCKFIKYPSADDHEHEHGHNHTIHFTGVNDATLRFVPYYEIEKEDMTCFAFFTED